MHHLDGVRAKLARAEEHLAVIQSIAKDCKAECALVQKEDVNSDIVSVIANFPDPPLKLSVVIGDCLHNMRASLDHLVRQLVVVNEQPINDKGMFPICERPGDFRKRIKDGRLLGVSPEAQALIESLQPYQIGQFRDSPLWLLNELINIDKHRALALTSSIMQDTKITSIDGRVLSIEGVTTFGGTLHDNAQIVAIQRSKLLNPDGEMQMHVNGDIHVAFKDGPAAGIDAAMIVEILLDCVRDHIISTFEPFFD